MAIARKFAARVARVIAHLPDVYSLELIPEDTPPRFRAGQFLHLALDSYEPSAHWPESRAFSIASAPNRGGPLRLTYAVKGSFTGRMAGEIHQGSKVWLKGPYGTFFVEAQPQLDTVLVAGGTGITPFVGFLEQACDEGSGQSITLFYGVRSPRHLLYATTVARCKAELRAFRGWQFIETATEPLANCETGRLDLAHLWGRLRSPGDSLFYLSGPPIMVRDLRAGLERRGIARDRIRTDDWE